MAPQNSSKIFLRPKKDSMIGMPKFDGVLRENFDRNSRARPPEHP
jgi:hypothetical protein